MFTAYVYKMNLYIFFSKFATVADYLEVMS